ncbi:hypothetical protein [Microbulbifer agarilyticus]|uniref:hypothetical protein n=1 Tax=Microbulbifer agarilyticus TaxID=260552 RepID=UPI001CD51F0F|nr:hypothetical protein [Microbulbifer agarilyticus]MCA0895128.1 hypothetical protein [Microbulbifer agarilyticus]
MDFDSELKKIPFMDLEADIEQMYCFTDALEKNPKKREAVPAIFRFFEAHSDKDLGSPGPLVHFLEEENDYLRELERSVSRKPTDLTVWMINRVINGAEPKDRKHWLTILDKVVKHPKTDTRARESAKEFIEYQGEKI